VLGVQAGLLPVSYVELTYPWNKAFVRHMKELTEGAENDYFKSKLIEAKGAKQLDKVHSAIVAQLEAEREKAVMDVLVKATREYIRWRRGEKWR
jgi:hypothetical protein